MSITEEARHQLYRRLEERLSRRVEAMLHRELRAQTFRMTAAFTGLAGLFVAAVKF